MAINSLRIKTKIDNSGVDAQIKQLENKLNDLKATLVMADEDKSLFTKDEILGLQVEIEKTEKKLKSLKKETYEYQDVNTKTFTKGINSLKKFGLSLFSIRSIYSLLSRASQSYLSQNEQTANKLQSIWTFLGYTIGPVVEYIANGILKLIGYLNEFLKVFGIDIVAKANAKALNNQAKAQEKLNNQMASFDEKNTLSENTNSTSSSASNGSGIDLSSVQLNENIVEKIQNLAKWLKENKDLIEAVGKTLALVFGVSAINKILSGIGSLIGSATLGTGLSGLNSMLLGLATVFVITLAIKGYEEVKQKMDEFNGTIDATVQLTNSVTEKQKEQSKTVWDAYEKGQIAEGGMRHYKDALDLTTESLRDNIKGLQEEKTWLGGLIGTNEGLTKQQEALSDQLLLTADDYLKLHKAGEITDDEFVNFMGTMKDMIVEFEKNGMNVDDLKMKYLDLTNDPYELTVKAKFKDEVTNKWQNMLKNLSSGSGLGGLFSQAISSLTKGVSGGNRFALGGIVTQPTRALIGEAGYPEAVVPMTQDYLSTLASLIAKYGGNASGKSSTTNIYLDGRLIQRQIASRTEEVNFAKNE